MDHIKIIILFSLVLLFSKISFCQKIEMIDSSEAYILSVFRFENDTLDYKQYNIPFEKINSPNTLQVFLLKPDIKNSRMMQVNLLTGDNKYNFISKKETKKAQFIDSIISNFAIANMFFIPCIINVPTLSIESNLYVDNTDTSLIKKYLFYSKNPINKNYYEETFTSVNTLDIIDGRIISDFISVIQQHNNYNNPKRASLIFCEDCFFLEKGIYYMLLRVKIIYVIIDDTNYDFLFSGNSAIVPTPLGNMKSIFYLCKKHPVTIQYFEKNSKKPIAIPLNIELLKPYNEIYRVYDDN